MCRRFTDALAGTTVAAVLAVGVGGPPPAGAESLTMILDTQRTTIQWVLGGFPDTVHGTFRLAQGVVRFDQDSGTADGCLRVDAATGQSGNPSRDRKMHEQILETARYPQVTLRPTRLQGALPAEGTGALSLEGLLSLHGAQRPVTLPARATRHGSSVTAGATLTIPYVAWGLVDPSVFIFRAAKTVDLELHAIGTIAPSTSWPVSCEPQVGR